jgi:hypothetical protein
MNSVYTQRTYRMSTIIVLDDPGPAGPLTPEQRAKILAWWDQALKASLRQTEVHEAPLFSPPLANG